MQIQMHCSLLTLSIKLKIEDRKIAQGGQAKKKDQIGVKVEAQIFNKAEQNRPLKIWIGYFLGMIGLGRLIASIDFWLLKGY